MAMPYLLPPRLNLAVRPTPLQLLTRVSAQLGGPRIWVKRDDLTGSVLSGNKVRKLEFTLAAALAEGADTIITCGGLQSNHCRATAILCAQLGLQCELVLRGAAAPAADTAPDGNLLLDHLVGARVQVHPPRHYQHNLDELLAATSASARAQGRRPFIIPTGASDGIGAWGYIDACAELRDDFAMHGVAPSHIICASGSGGTQAGLSAGVVLHKINATVWGIAVCDDAAYFEAKVRADLNAWQRRYGVELDLEALPVRVLDGYVAPGYGQATAAVFDTIKWLARTEGLVLDPVYTGKAFHALVEELKRGRFDDSSDVVFVHTGGVFGLFAQREQLHF
jgi:D-cysteine desulfhydrase